MNEEDSLRSLLQEWEAPEPSAALDARVRAVYHARRSAFWKQLWSFRVSVPAPGLVAAVLMIVVGLWIDRRSVPPQPATPPAPAAGGYMTRLETAGFQPLPDGEIRVIRSGVKQ
ncbi:MAG TPA: hypothetical protein VGF49_11690 [Candidatus Solibacter sp.]